MTAGQTVRVTHGGLEWSSSIGPGKRTAMNPMLTAEMRQILDALGADEKIGATKGGPRWLDSLKCGSAAR